MNNREKTKFGYLAKSNMQCEKLYWFLDRIPNVTKPLTPEDFENHMNEYLKRFDDEIEQIKLKQSISKNRLNQHNGRLDAITMTLERDLNEYKGGGMEMIDLCDPEKFESLMLWDKQTKTMQHLKFDRISEKYLHSLKNKTKDMEQ